MYFYDQAVEWLGYYRPSWRSQRLVHITWIPSPSRHETISDGSHSDSEDDSIRPSQPSGWDGWHRDRSAVTRRPRPAGAAARDLGRHEPDLGVTMSRSLRGSTRPE